MRYVMALCHIVNGLVNSYHTPIAKLLDVLIARLNKSTNRVKPGVKMEVTVHIPDSIGERLGKDAEAIPRWLLEKAGLEAYRSGEISGYELRLMLGISSRLELEAFLKTHGVYLAYTEEDLVHDAETSRQLKLKHAQSE